MLIPAVGPFHVDYRELLPVLSCNSIDRDILGRCSGENAGPNIEVLGAADSIDAKCLEDIPPGKNSMSPLRRDVKSFDRRIDTVRTRLGKSRAR